MKKFKSKNILVVGSNGSGKSNFVDNLIVSFLKENDPENLKLLLIDPKRVNFLQYSGVAHLLSDLIVEPSKAKSAFKWAWGESLRRLKFIEGVDIESIYEYKGNKDFRNNLPEIIIVMEELADYMIFDDKFFETYIKRITALSEVTGIFIVVATTKPIDAVLTKELRSSFWDRITFRLPSEKDSILAMGEGGAEKLDKVGSCFMKDFADSKIQKVQMPYISDEEIRDVIKSMKEKYTDFQILMNAKDAVEQKEEDLL